GLAAFTGKLTVGKSQLLAHPVTHSGFRLQHDDLTSRTYSHLPKHRSQFIKREGVKELIQLEMANALRQITLNPQMN
ncbi:hypothetical protein KFV98_17995, partial [Klebsiella quasipneumoniae]|nr:hypothetical protein [Klebsiella quasipneumoniae]